MVREEERVAVTTADEEEITTTSDNLAGDRQSTARSQAEIADLYSSDPLTKRDRDLDYLDIPAFLRREED